MSNRFYPNTGKVLSTHFAPVMVDCNFIVDSTNGNGLGIRSLKGNGVANVFMNTSSTPGMGNQGVTNPNPEAGIIMVQLADNYNRLYTVQGGFVSPLTGTQLTSVTSGNPYVITGLGTGTQAQWQAIGLPNGDAPAIGAAFIATASTSVPTGGHVQAPSQSGIVQLEVIGDSNQTIAPVGLVSIPGIGAQILLQCLASSSSGPTAPANNSVCSLAFLLSNSSVQVAGE